MQVLVVYHSKTGRTKALAEAVAEGIRGVDGVQAIVRTTEDVTEEEFVRCSGVIAGSPVYFGTMAAELKSVFDRFIATRPRMVDKVAAAFASGAHHSGGKETTLLSILEAFLIYGMMVVGDPLVAGGHYGVASAGEPDEKTLDDARGLGGRVAAIVRRLT
ncbi:NAD(P)H-dependent oxidoreductase [Candidatus Bipolaricaulota bacterium]|nr:NAD(P)H-dependent oxidoreductase [Candidatus Bipolaricaulota bacterium]